MRKNRLLIILGIVVFWMGKGVSQSATRMDSLVAAVNTYLDAYGGLSPFGREELIPLNHSGLPAETLQYVKAHAGEYDGYFQDSISEYSLLLEFQDLIINGLFEIIGHEQFTSVKIEELIKGDGDLSIVVSDDRKLYNFSLDEKTGGTYRSRISITHYIEHDPPKRPVIDGVPDDYVEHDVLEGDGFDAIYTLETEEGPKYVLTGYVRGCSYCFETNVMLVSIREGVFEVDFSYSLVSRSWEEGVHYDHEKNIITVDYITDDLTTDCYCDDEVEAELDDYHSVDSEEELISLRCHCTYQFDGSNFRLVKQSAKKAED